MAPDKEKIMLSDIIGDIFQFDSLASTQDKAKEMLKAGHRPPFVIVAGVQMAGRGRFSRQWVSPPGGTYFSWVVQAQTLQAVPLVVAIAIHRELEKLHPGKLQIKWPNDILLDGRKLAGILVEAINDTLIIGIGINTFDAPMLPDELLETGAVMPLLSGEKETLMDELLNELDNVWQAFQKGGFAPFHDEYISRSIPIGTAMRVSGSNEISDGKFAGISNIGELLLGKENKIFSFDSGEAILCTNGHRQHGF